MRTEDAVRRLQHQCVGEPLAREVPHLHRHRTYAWYTAPPRTVHTHTRAEEGTGAHRMAGRSEEVERQREGDGELGGGANGRVADALRELSRLVRIGQ